MQKQGDSDPGNQLSASFSVTFTSVTNPVRLAGHMERASLVLREGVEQNGEERGYILRCFFRIALGR